MAEEIKYIRNRFKEYDQLSVIDVALKTLESWRKKKEEPNPKWIVFFVIRWALVYSPKRNARKIITPQKFDQLATNIMNCNPEFITKYFKQTVGIARFFLPVQSQQFYYQMGLDDCHLASQLKVFSIIKRKFSCQESFQRITGLSIKDFLTLCQIFRILAFYRQEKANSGVRVSSLSDDDFAEIARAYVSIEDYRKYLSLLSFSLDDAKDKIESYYPTVRDLTINLYQMSFMVFHPFFAHSKKHILIDSGLFSYTCAYYIYDLLKSRDSQFSDSFGYIFEDYIKLTFQEFKGEVWEEARLKALLPLKSKVCDFYLPQEDIFIECKSSEINSVTSIIPTEERLIRDFKSSFSKAYFEQLLPNAKFIAPHKENWGVILTYKGFLWGTFNELYELAKGSFPGSIDNTCLPPENVFIIDLYNWHKLLKICEKHSLKMSNIFAASKRKNLDPNERMMMFAMHLEAYELNDLKFDFLKEEFAVFNFTKK